MTTYKLVPELNGIEIYFDKKPNDEVCAELKDNGWRWHFTKRCWYTRLTKSAESFAKRLCSSDNYPKKPNLNNLSIHIDQYYQNVYVSTVTITPSNGSFLVSSTNNMIICTDCNHFFSVHAVACPFCGCLLSYIAEHQYHHFHPEAVKKREQEERDRIKAREKEILQYKMQEIQDLERYCDITHNFSKLLELDGDVFDEAISRAMHIDDLSDSLPYLTDWVWWELLTLDEAEYLLRLEDLKEEHSREQIRKKADSVQRKIEQLKIQALGKEYGLMQSTMDRLIELNTPYDDIVAHLELIRYYLQTYPQIGLQYDQHIFIPMDLLKKKIQHAIACGEIYDIASLSYIENLDMDSNIPF